MNEIIFLILWIEWELWRKKKLRSRSRMGHFLDLMFHWQFIKCLQKWVRKQSFDSFNLIDPFRCRLALILSIYILFMLNFYLTCFFLPAQIHSGEKYTHTKTLKFIDRDFGAIKIYRRMQIYFHTYSNICCQKISMKFLLSPDEPLNICRCLQCAVISIDIYQTVRHIRGE